MSKYKPVATIINPEDEDKIIRKAMEKFSKDPAHDAPIVLEVIEIIKKTQNPEKGKMIEYLTGLYFELSAKAELKNIKKIKLFKKSLEYYQEEKDVQRIKSQIVQVEISQVRNQKKLPTFLIESKLLELYNLIKGGDNEKEKNTVFGLYLMYKALTLLGRPESLQVLFQSEESLKKGRFIDGVYKVRSMRFKLQSHYQTDPVKALEYIKNAISETEKTKDKYGLGGLEADMHYLQGFIAKNSQERAEEYEKAGQLYIKFDPGLGKRMGYNLLATAYYIKSHQPGIAIEEVLKYEKLSAEAHKKSGNVNAYHDMRGAYYGVMAIKQMVNGKNKDFLHFCNLALKEFEKSNNRKEAEFFFGILSIGYSSYLPTNKKLEALEIANDLLERRGQGLFAKYELYKLRASNEPSPQKQAEYKRSALECLEKLIPETERFNTQEPVGPDLKKITDDSKKLLYLYKSDKFQIEAQLSQDLFSKSEKYKLAQKQLEDLAEQYPDHVFSASRGLGWLNVETGDYDKAVEKFTVCVELKPKNEDVINELNYAKGLLKTNFRKLKEEKQLKEVFLSQAFRGFFLQEDPLLYGEFIPKLLRTITKRGFQFEESPATYNKKTEPELRDEILSDLNIVFVNEATAESKIGDGKTDIRLKNPFTLHDKAIAECKWWGGQMQYEAAKQQLFSYLPPRQEYGIIITFCSEKDFNLVLEKAKQTIKSMSDYIDGSLANLNIIPGKNFSFISRHTFNKGGEIEIYHLFFNLFSEKVK